MTLKEMVIEDIKKQEEVIAWEESIAFMRDEEFIKQAKTTLEVLKSLLTSLE